MYYVNYYLQKALNATDTIYSNFEKLRSYGILKKYLDDDYSYSILKDSEVESLLKSARESSQEAITKLPLLLSNFRQLRVKIEVLSTSIKFRLSTCADQEEFATYHGTFPTILTEGNAVIILDQLVCKAHEALNLFEHVNLLVHVANISNFTIDRDAQLIDTPPCFCGSFGEYLSKTQNKILTNALDEVLFAAYNEAALSLNAVMDLTTCSDGVISSNLRSVLRRLNTTVNFALTTLGNVPLAKIILEKIRGHIACHELYGRSDGDFFARYNDCPFIPRSRCSAFAGDFSSKRQSLLSSNKEVINHLGKTIRKLDEGCSIGKTLVFLEDETLYSSLDLSCTELPSKFYFNCLRFSQNITNLTLTLVAQIRGDCNAAIQAMTTSRFLWEDYKVCGSVSNDWMKAVLQNSRKTLSSVSCTIKKFSLGLKFYHWHLEEISSKMDYLLVNAKNFSDRIDVLVDTCKDLEKDSKNQSEEDLFMLETNVNAELRRIEMLLNTAVDNVERTVSLLNNPDHHCIVKV